MMTKKITEFYDEIVWIVGRVGKFPSFIMWDKNEMCTYKAFMELVKADNNDLGIPVVSENLIVAFEDSYVVRKRLGTWEGYYMGVE